jgi:hypothetical protein
MMCNEWASWCRVSSLKLPMSLLLLCLCVLQGSLAEAMTDSMRNGQKVTNQLAKELLMEVLEDPSTALALKHILLDGNLRSSTRGLIHWLLREDWTLDETHKLVKWQLDGLLKNNMWTQKNLASTTHWVLGLKASPPTHVYLPAVLASHTRRLTSLLRPEANCKYISTA